jgi:hypothetical protein
VIHGIKRDHRRGDEPRAESFAEGRWGWLLDSGLRQWTVTVWTGINIGKDRCGDYGDNNESDGSRVGDQVWISA